MCLVQEELSQLCEKCNKSLHIKLCFQLFHEKEIFDLSVIIVYLKAFKFTD